MTESQEPERSTEPRSAPGKFVVGKLKRRRTMIVSYCINQNTSTSQVPEYVLKFMRIFTSQRPGLWILIVSCFFLVFLLFRFRVFFFLFCVCFLYFFFLLVSSSFALFVDGVFVWCCFCFFLFTMPCLLFCYISPTHIFQYYDYELLSKHKPMNAKCHIFLLFSWLQKMHISYVVDFVEIAACILQKVEYAFSQGKKNIFLENLGAIKNA